MATPNLGYQNFYSTTLSSTITASDTTIYLNALPTPSEGYLVIEPDSSTNREIIYYTSKGANFVTCPSVADGRGVGGTSAAAHSSGVAVQMNNNAELWTAIQDGSANTGMHQWFNDSFQDYILSGGTVTQATGLIASVSSGVAYINGRRLTFNAFSKTNTASKDVYYDIVAPSSVDNIATISYTELASGATGSAPVSNGVHLAFVNTGTNSIGTISQVGNDKLGNPRKRPTPSTPSGAASGSTLAGETTTSDTYTDLATVDSVDVVVGSSGMLLIGLKALIASDTANKGGAGTYVLSGSNTVAASDNNILVQQNVGNYAIEFGGSKLLTGLTPGVTKVKFQYRRIASGGITTIGRREFYAIPL